MVFPVFRHVFRGIIYANACHKLVFYHWQGSDSNAIGIARFMVYVFAFESDPCFVYTVGIKGIPNTALAVKMIRF